MKINSSMTIYIPTYGRIADGRHRTWDRMPDKWRPSTWLVVRSEEEQCARKLVGDRVLVCDKIGVAAARQAAMDHSPTRKVCMVDDDLDYARRVSDWDVETNARALKVTPKDV